MAKITRVALGNVMEEMSKAESEARDAARYRWLRANWASVHGVAWELADWQLDEKVDEEIGK